MFFNLLITEQKKGRQIMQQKAPSKLKSCYFFSSTSFSSSVTHIHISLDKKRCCVRVIGESKGRLINGWQITLHLVYCLNSKTRTVLCLVIMVHLSLIKRKTLSSRRILQVRISDTSELTRVREGCNRKK